jgi:tRNA-specific 2-thiouridylase
VERQAPAKDRGGPIRDNEGNELGRHTGVHRFTLGQRRGLGLTSPRPLYVLAIEAESRTLVVGDEDRLAGDRLVARDVNWLSIPPPTGEIRCQVRIRYRHTEAPAAIQPLPGARARVVFDSTQRAITPGQAAVFYDGELCLGGGWVEG